VIAALDVQYDEPAGTARIAAVVFDDWPAAAASSEHVLTTTGIAPYEPGAFYKRELPCLMAALADLPAPPDVIVIDGYVMLGDRPGLGMHLWEALGRTTPIVGVAKTRFHSAAAVEILRGDSRAPLFVTAVGIDDRKAAEHIRTMPGTYRIPTLLKRVDQLARGR
jgi:deoxyribonuclease V